MSGFGTNFDEALAQQQRLPRRDPATPGQVCPHCKTRTSSYRFQVSEGCGVEAHHCPYCDKDVVPIWSAVSHPVDWRNQQ